MTNASPTSLLLDTARLVDAAAGDRMLVIGSPPPEGRDLDLLARDPELRVVEAALDEAGFLRRGLHAVRFADGNVAVVELTPARHWRLSDEETDALFADARPLPGFERLVYPSAHHLLLMLAFDLVAEGSLREKHRRRIDAALEEEPDAWARARGRAGAWGGEEQLDVLERWHASGAEPSLGERRSVLVARFRMQGVNAKRANARAARELVSKPRLGAVVALSGLDGAGKSTQAELLVDTLDRLGHDAVAVWTRIAAEGWVWELRHRVGRVIRLLLRLRGRGGTRAEVRASPGQQDDITALRESSTFLTQAWATFVALANVYAHQRAVARHVAQGRVVVCDRWVLDSVVHLRARFGEERAWRGQALLIRLLSPKPARAFLLDISAEVAQTRKQEDEPEWLARLERLYREEQPRLGVRRLDGTRPRDELAAEIAREVWDALP